MKINNGVMFLTLYLNTGLLKLGFIQDMQCLEDSDDMTKLKIGEK